MNKKIVIVKQQCFSYCKESSFRPSIRYPEYEWIDDISICENIVYDMVRSSFHMMGYDAINFGKKEWNPLGGIVKPGDNVLIKPNMVMDKNHIIKNGVECLYTNPSVVAPVVDYVIKALNGRGKIVIGDAPMQECDFDRLIYESGYNSLISFYKNKLISTDIEIELVDFRGLVSKRINGINHSLERENVGTIVDIGSESEFYGESEYFYNNMRITNYDPSILKQHHNSFKNEYFINDNILSADVIINMPKPKTHRKAGVTISLKNLVGINVRKEYLPHHTNGCITEGGDEYLNKSIFKEILDIIHDKRNCYAQTKKKYFIAKLYGIFASIISRIGRPFYKDKYYEGSWYGNDTISRTIVDLNKILFYADKRGILQKNKQRKYLIVADMIVSGHKEGPVAPSPKNMGVIAIGEDPVCFDEIIARLMGAKLDKIHTLRHARYPKGNHKLTEKDSEAIIVSNDIKINLKKIHELTKDDLWYFDPTSGWKEAFYSKDTNF